jgi:signal peptidase I
MKSSRRAYVVIGIGAVLAIFGTLFGARLFVRQFINRSGSMEDTLKIGDRILVQLLPRPLPKRGDIVLFRYPVDRQQTYIKRVMGMPGDRIKMIRKQLYVNGAAVQEPYVTHKAAYEDSYRDNFPAEPDSAVTPGGLDMLRNHVSNGEVTVPDGSYFMLGDNRDLSWDSRYFGFVRLEDLLGKPLTVY